MLHVRLPSAERRTFVSKQKYDKKSSEMENGLTQTEEH